MAVDVADYTQAVNVIGGSVSISGIATVTISGTPAVTISGTPTVNIGTAPTITITGSVSISSGTVNIGNTPAVTISGTPTVSISGTPTVILGGGTASIGSISAIGSTVTVAGTINIGNTPAVTISGTPNVNIGSSGTVAISGTPNVNITQAAGLASVAYGPNLLTAARSGPITSGWVGENATLAFLADGTMRATNNAGGQMNVVTAASLLPVSPGQTIYIQARVKAVTRDDGPNQIGARVYDAAGVNFNTPGPANTATPVGSWVLCSGTFVIPAGGYFMSPFCLATTAGGTAGDQYLISDVFCAVVGTVGVAGVVNINAIASTVTVAISGTPTVNIGNTPAVTISGTPSVTIASGTVNIGGTPNINISSQSVNLNTQQPQSALADLTFPAGLSTQTTAAMPTGTHSLELAYSAGSAGSSLTGLTVTGHTSGVQYYPAVTNNVFFTDSSLNNLALKRRIVVQVDPLVDSTYDIAATNSGAASGTVKVTAFLDTQAVWVANSPLAPVFIAISGADGQQALPVDTIGFKATYWAAGSVAFANPATDIVTIAAPTTGTTVIRVLWIKLTLTATTAAQVIILLLRRSTADTAGTSTTATAVKTDTQDPAAVGIVTVYTANPTLGTLLGNVGARRTEAVLAPALPDVLEWTFGDHGGSKPIVLRSNINQQLLAVSLNGAGVTGGSLGFEICWTESPN